ncbi:MAG: nuoM [Gammaproteobacteria bacterium]|jgi:NADH-quinone oxidoreductase subunit M|nr:nuoM [Gammaproteobacteria bacterium]
MLANYLLSLLIWLPIVGGMLVLMLSKIHSGTVLPRWVALLFAVATLGLCVPLYMGFDASSYHMQYVENYSWIPQFGLRYALGVDGISLLFIALTCFTNLIIILAAWRVVKHHVAQYMAVFLFSTGIMNGAFCSLDAILFYSFWEASMIPMYLGIGMWGGQRRAYAAIKFFLYTLLGSVFMLIAFLYLAGKSGSFSIIDFQNISLSPYTQNWVFLAFLAAFAVKIPMWPVHTWLPDAHTEAPAGGSVVLAALMLKMGAYGFIRLAMPIVPGVTQSMDWLLIALSLIAIVYVGFATIVQKDMKRLIAYSSVSHMGLVTLGIFMVFRLVREVNGINFPAHEEAIISVQGAMFQMIAHAFSSGALFLGASLLFQRFGSRQINDYRGLANVMPIFAAFYMLFAMANVGLPGTSGFVGEFLIILAAFKVNFWVALAAGSTLVIAPAYTLWMYKRVLFGEVKNHSLAKGKDVTGLELFVFILLAAPILIFGIYPDLILQVSHATVAHFVDLVVSKVAASS